MNGSRSRDFLWMSLALTPLLAVSFLLPIQPQDYWWILRVGQETVQNGAIPIVDTISASRAGQPILYQPWLAGVLFYLIDQLGDAAGTFVLRGALLGCAYAVLWKTARRASNPPTATFLILALGFAGGNNWAMRSQLFAYPLFAVTLAVLLRWHNDTISSKKTYLWTLPPVAALWANLHGSFVLPLILAGLALLFGRGDKKALAPAFAAMLLATLLNPRGFGAWQYFAAMMRSPSDQLFAFEWSPPRNEGWQMNLFFGWLLLFAPLASFSPKKLSALEWAFFLSFGWLALSGMRYVFWFLALLAPLTAALLSDWVKRFERSGKNFPALDFAFGALTLCAAALFLPGIRERWMGDSVPMYERSTSPVAAAEWLRSRPGLPGELFADYAFGGYLSFHLPERKPWMDSRFNAFPPEQWAEYVAVSKGEGWQEVFEREGINLLLLSRASQSKLIEAVSASPEWREEYRDEYAVVFSRRAPRP